MRNNPNIKEKYEMLNSKSTILPIVLVLSVLQIANAVQWEQNTGYYGPGVRILDERPLCWFSPTARSVESPYQLTQKVLEGSWSYIIEIYVTGTSNGYPIESHIYDTIYSGSEVTKFRETRFYPTSGNTYEIEVSDVSYDASDYAMGGYSVIICKVPSVVLGKPSKAGDPRPSNGAINLPTNVHFGWSDDGGATSYDIYFGTDPTLEDSELTSNLTGKAYDPGALLDGTTYYWRIDSNNTQGATEGDIWSFTTREAAAAKIIYVDVNANGANNGSSWVDSYIYLQDALADANSVEKPVEIHVAQGVYKPDQGMGLTAGNRKSTFQLINGVFILGGYAGITGTKPNTRDIKVYESILSGDLNTNDGLDFTNISDNSYHVVTGSGTGAATVLDGFTISHGFANGAGTDNDGAGMYNHEGSPTVTNCVFSVNKAGEYGGGLSNIGHSSPILSNCTFSRNETEGYGGGICNRDNSNPTLSRCIFSENSARYDGGGMYNWVSSPVLINCTLNENSANEGGGIGNCSSSDPILGNCIVSGNSATYGGGMNSYGTSSPSLANCTFVGNSAQKGNALSCDSFRENDPGNVTLINCILWDGRAETQNIGHSRIMISYSNVYGSFVGKGNIEADPQFVDFDNGDYHLSDSSPCIGAGILTLGVPNIDIEGNPRPNPPGSHPDMGAYENGPPWRPSMAINPSPADGITTGQKKPVLRWTPGDYAIEHDVYLGNDFRDVNNADTSDISGIYQGRLLDAAYVTEELDLDCTYYWRIDEVGHENMAICKGNVWSFTVVDAIFETVEYTVSSSEDDGYATGSNLQNLDGLYMKVGSSSFAQPPYYRSGMVFRNVNIPQGAEIVSAHLKIRAYNSRLTDTVYGKIEAETSDDSAGFGGAHHIGSLTLTSASINWDIDEPWVADTWYTSPNIAYVIQEVINRDGWSADNSLAILYSTRQQEGGYRNVSSYDRGSDYAPKLEITFVP